MDSVGQRQQKEDEKKPLQPMNMLTVDEIEDK